MGILITLKGCETAYQMDRPRLVIEHDYSWIHQASVEWWKRGYYCDSWPALDFHEL